MKFKTKKVLKWSLFTFCILIGIFIIILTSVASSLVSGIDIENIDKILEYTSFFEVPIDNEVSLMMTLININKYSHWILTADVMWMTFLALLWNKINKRVK